MAKQSRYRMLNDWLSGYLKFTEGTEPPESYHTWMGIGMVAAALRRKVHISWGFERIYPNFYIVLVGPSGRCRKGTAMNIGKDILKEVQIPITSESVTREALIRHIKNSVENFVDPDTNIPKFHCSLTAISPELSVFLMQNDLKFLADLTDWYDAADEWKYETKGSGTDHIQGMWFNLIGATAPDWLQAVLPAEAIGGGFTSRIIFIVEETKKQTVALPKYTQWHRDLRKALIHDLERIATMVGEMEMSEEAASKYMSWYEEEDAKIRKGVMPVADPRFAGYCDRRATHLRKLCIIMSASRSNDLYIHSDDFDRALKVLKAAEVRMTKVFSGLGSAPYSQVTEKILRFIEARQQVLRSELLANFYRDIDIQILSVIQDVLEKMKVISVRILPEQNDAVYSYIGGGSEKPRSNT